MNLKLVDVDQFGLFLSESFPEGVTRRELRLSAEEVDYITAKFPKSLFKELSEIDHHSDGKTWFEVHIEE